MRIRTRLRALILITLLPVTALGAATAYLLVEKERETMELAARARVRGLMAAVDAELRGSIAPLELLARSPRLDLGDLAAFRDEALLALEARRGHWANILLSRPDDGEMLMNLLIAPGTPLQPPADPESIQEAGRTARPTVSRVETGHVIKQPLFAVRVPVIRDGKVKYVLSSVQTARTVERVLDQHAFPADWAVAVLDARNRFVARWPLPREHTDFASESLQQALAGAPEGAQRGLVLDGAEIYRAYARSPFSSWAVATAVPRHVVEAGLRATLLLFAGVIVAAALGLWIAWLLAARLTRPIAALVAAAPSLGRGDTSALPAPSTVDEVRELTRALEEAAVAIRDREARQKQAEQALRATDRAKDEFLAMLGHELRNPLAAISNAAQLLERSSGAGGPVAGIGAILQRQVRHMTHLVDDLLEVGRVTGGKIQLQRAPVDLAQLTQQVVATWRSGGRLAQHDVRSHLRPAWVHADPVRMEQVVINLLDNALKFTPAGGRIDISVGPRGDKTVLEVRDRGEGMPAELLARVFDLFVQGERSLAREPGGLGIGLTMAKRLVELHDGTIQAASGGAGEGATFTVVLPSIERPQEPPDEPSTARAPTRKRRILLVEDSDDARESIIALLRANGHEVYGASTGLGALDMAAGTHPDVALVDIGLPDIDGYELARRLQALATSQPMRLVALTGYGTQADRDRARAAGFDAHLTKPVSVEAIEALLDGAANAVPGAAATPPSRAAAKGP
jgi:signal transduction histidine kinase/CheY-like chemotaxis protein